MHDLRCSLVMSLPTTCVLRAMIWTLTGIVAAFESSSVPTRSSCLRMTSSLPLGT